MAFERLRESKNHLFLEEYKAFISYKLSGGDIAAADCYKQAPTLIELRTFFERCKERGIAMIPERGEWTSDFADLSYEPEDIGGSVLPEGYIHALYISRPEQVTKEGAKWKALGGKRIPVVLPPNGWVLPDDQGKMYDKTTGLPYRTVEEIEQATGTYYWRGDKEYGLVAVDRVCERTRGDDFDMSLVQEPDFGHFNIGYRQIWRF